MNPVVPMLINVVKNNPSLLALTPPGLAYAGYKLATSQAQAGGKTMADTGRGILDIPGIDINWGGILPGGDPFIVPEAPAAGWVYGWTANGQVFYRTADGRFTGTYTKTGGFKTWRHYHPIVFGKRDDPRKLARVIKRHHGAWKELNKVFGKHHREAPRRK